MKYENYYISLKSDINEDHLVHKESCPFIPDKKDRIFLGKFRTPDDAIKVAGRFLARPCKCIFCGTDNQVDQTLHAHSETMDDTESIASDMQRNEWESALVFGLN